ncbi:Transposase [Rhizoctonia solani]|uniref:Transposase n=1 Tax=Rhizoctonia solani TaxID=456999 RepID=A0A8H7M1Y4_9AGAM|nr:Transposase [Rhizoctonia solani]
MARYTSPETKAQIIALKKLEYSDRAIVQLLQPQTEVSHATVGRIWAKYGLTDRPLNRHDPIPGRPRKLTPSNVRFAALALARSRVPTAANIRRQYFPAVGSSTLRRYLRELGLRPYKRRQVPLLTYRHRKARRAWAHTVNYSGHNHAGTTSSSRTKSESSYLGPTAANITGGGLVSPRIIPDTPKRRYCRDSARTYGSRGLKVRGTITNGL